jgi:hypothetical protein
LLLNSITNDENQMQLAIFKSKNQKHFQLLLSALQKNNTLKQSMVKNEK